VAREPDVGAKYCVPGLVEFWRTFLPY